MYLLFLLFLRLMLSVAEKYISGNLTQNITNNIDTKKSKLIVSEISSMIQPNQPIINNILQPIINIYTDFKAS